MLVLGLIMEFMDVVTARKSVRDYEDKPVEEEKLTAVLEAARWAPSWAIPRTSRSLP